MGGLPQKEYVHIYLVLPNMTCVFAVLCIPGVVYQLTLWPLITALYCGWTLSHL